MQVRKIVIAGFAAGVLGFQLLSISPFGGQAWYWPFTNYPMYATAHLPGEDFRQWRLAVVGVTAQGIEADTLRMSWAELHIDQFRYIELLTDIADWAENRPAGSPENARHALERIESRVRAEVPWDSFHVVVEEQRFRVEEAGLVDRHPPWSSIYAWKVRPATNPADAKEM